MSLAAGGVGVIRACPGHPRGSVRENAQKRVTQLERLVLEAVGRATAGLRPIAKLSDPRQFIAEKQKTN